MCLQASQYDARRTLDSVDMHQQFLFRGSSRRILQQSAFQLVQADARNRRDLLVGPVRPLSRLLDPDEAVRVQAGQLVVNLLRPGAPDVVEVPVEHAAKAIASVRRVGQQREEGEA